MYARARYKYPAHRPAPMCPKQMSALSHGSMDGNRMPAVAADTSNTTCMVCGLTSDPFLILLCDGCDNEAHLACAGLSHVPEGEWFCSSCRPRGHAQTKTTHPHAAPAKPSSQSNNTRREPGELDEIDGILITAFADDDAEFRLVPPSQEHHQHQGTSQPLPQLQPRSQAQPRPRKRSRSQQRSQAVSQSQSQSQSRPLRHELLFSGTRVGANGSNSTT